MSLIRGKRPPTQALPCLYCGKRLKPNFVIAWVRVETEDGFEGHNAYTGAVRGYGYASHGLFCSLGHGYEYGRRQAALQAEIEKRKAKPK